MALLWCDGFDHYGLDESFLIDGVYASAESCTLTTAHPATGTHGIYIDNDNFAGDTLRKVLPSATDKMGSYARFYFDGLPSGNVGGTIFEYCSGSGATLPHISVVVDSSGALRFLRGRNYFTLNGENGTLIAQSDPVIVPSANNSIEVQIYLHDTLGWVRAAVNGVHVFQAENLDTRRDSTDITGVAHVAGITGSIGGSAFFMDDLFHYDFTGDSAVDTDFCPMVDGSGIGTNYMGELQVMLLPPDADTATSDWVRVSGSNDYEMVNETTPDDATYIYSTTNTDVSEFEMTDLPEDITYVRGLQLLGRMSKADAGVCMIKYGVKSDGVTEDSDEFPITVQPTYWWKFQNTDPDSGARWTRASLNAAYFRLLRTL